MIVRPTNLYDAHPWGDSEIIKLDTPIDGVKQIIYVQIPKNASYWAKYHLAESNPYNYHDNEFDVDSTLFTVILRDPLKRWVSGMGQFLAGHPPLSQYNIDRLDWSQVLDTVVYDNHTHPQVDYIANILYNNIVWFRCDQDLTKNFTAWSRQFNINLAQLSESADIENIFNVTKKVPSRLIESNNYMAPPQQEIVDKLVSVLEQHPEYVERIKEFYKKDYELYHSVPYYVTR